MHAMEQLYDNIEKRRAEMKDWNESFKNGDAMNECDGGAESDVSDDSEMCGDDGDTCYVKGGEECKIDQGNSSGSGSPPLKADPAWSKPSYPEPVVGVGLALAAGAPVAKVLLHQPAGAHPKLAEDVLVGKAPAKSKKTAQDSACCVVM